MSETQPDLREALAYLTPRPATKGPVILDPVKMRSAVSALQAEVERLQKVEGERDEARHDAFVAFVLKWCDRGPPHGGPGNEAVALGAIAHHPVVRAARQALRSNPLTKTKEGSEHA